MKIKKKELRKREAQLPINYPDPEVLADALPGGAIDLETEMVEVELLCKRLAHNEVVVRDAVLDELPKYLERLTTPMKQMEAEYVPEIASVTAYFAAHPKANNFYHYDNLPVALQTFREKAQTVERTARRREAVRELKRVRAQERREREMEGRFGAAAAAEEEEGEDDAAFSEEEDAQNAKKDGAASKVPNEHRAKYEAWMHAWCDLELVLLKLSRGLHFCLWHSDKPLVQLACAQRIVDLTQSPCTTRCKTLLFGSLLRVLSREWPSIDRYRLDKYLALVRKMVFAWVSLIKEVGAQEERNLQALAVVSASSVQTTPQRGSTGGRLSNGGESAGKRSRSAASSGNQDAKSSFSVAAATTTPKLSRMARSIGESYLRMYFADQPQLCGIISEALYILHSYIFSSSTSVGLTMHISDVSFDELDRAQLPPQLFVALAAGVPLYAMSQGNFVEKRVLDNFFPPLAGSVLVSRRTERLAIEMGKAQAHLKKAQRKCAEVLEVEAHEVAERDNQFILGELARCCKQYAVAKGTVRAVRVMFSEAELILRQSMDPGAYTQLNRTSQRRRLEKEIEEVNDTRRMVREERVAVKAAKKEARSREIKEKVAERKAARLAAKQEEETEAEEKAAAAGGKSKKLNKTKKKVLASVKDDAEEEKTIRREVTREVLGKRKKPVQDSKRKKHYKLTTKDLYGDADVEEGK